MNILDSEDFFKAGTYFKGKQGVYVIEQPLFKNKAGERMFKVGFARDSLYKRMRDYKTAYGIIHFKIHAIYEVPEKVVHRRPNFARLTESRLHYSLQDKLVMKNAETNKQEGEWFYDLPVILTVLKAIDLEYQQDIKQAEDWSIIFTSIKYNDVEPDFERLVPEEDISSKMKYLVVQDREPFKRRKTGKLVKPMSSDFIDYTQKPAKKPKNKK
jgi:hypothetical protein